MKRIKVAQKYSLSAIWKFPSANPSCQTKYQNKYSWFKMFQELFFESLIALGVKNHSWSSLIYKSSIPLENYLYWKSLMMNISHLQQQKLITSCHKFREIIFTSSPRQHQRKWAKSLIISDTELIVKSLYSGIKLSKCCEMKCQWWFKLMLSLAAEWA